MTLQDSHTSRFLYERLFRGPLFKHRTVILVTHHVNLVLPGADYLVKMHDGQIQHQGGIVDLRNKNILESIVSLEHEGEAGRKEEVNHRESEVEEVEETIHLLPGRKSKNPRKLIEDERREVGSVKWSIYKTYLKAS